MSEQSLVTEKYRTSLDARRRTYQPQILTSPDNPQLSAQILARVEIGTSEQELEWELYRRREQIEFATQVLGVDIQLLMRLNAQIRHTLFRSGLIIATDF